MVHKYGCMIEDILFTRSSNNHQGVIVNLVHQACEQQFKEILLCYFFLCLEGPKTHAQLRLLIHEFLNSVWSENYHLDKDDDEEDHGQKLRSLHEDPKTMSLNLKEALEKLEKWNLIRFDGEQSHAIPVKTGLIQIRFLMKSLMQKKVEGKKGFSPR
eukprot:TRINITY_DN3114_c0_g1_i15.p1 TRINITY_DN3114_c0_g1~~TRINITY_DN3114_c0_g1_i15.p1  ORF type:complete len:157 (-),score=36.88 TRINITY_DN3114_c0_g1_i15:36-506(-)